MCFVSQNLLVPICEVEIILGIFLPSYKNYQNYFHTFCDQEHSVNHKVFLTPHENYTRMMVDFGQELPYSH